MREIGTGKEVKEEIREKRERDRPVTAGSERGRGRLFGPDEREGEREKTNPSPSYVSEQMAPSLQLFDGKDTSTGAAHNVHLQINRVRSYCSPIELPRAGPRR